MRLTLTLGIAAAAMALGACGTNTMSDDTADVDCSTVTNADTFTVGLEKMGAGGILDFQLMSINPAPAVRGNNTWIVQVNSMSNNVVGSPIDGATVDVSSYMPAHGHYSAIPAVVTPSGTTGQYTLTPVNLWMPGVWETTISATAPSGTDRALYRFCIP